MVKPNKEKYLKIFIFSGIGIAFLTGGIIYALSSANGSGAGGFPAEFITAYKNAVGDSKKIVELTNAVNQKIAEVNSFDSSGKIQKALELISSANQDNNAARETATNLVASMAALTKSASALPSQADQQAVLDAIAIESNLIREFINYTQKVNQFLTVLSVAIVSDSFNDRLAVSKDLEEVNRQSRIINNLNQEFLNRIEKVKILP